MTTLDEKGAIARAAGTTVSGLVASRARVLPDAPAIDDRGVVRTYAELTARFTRLAGALVSRGVTRGDRVAVLSENRGEYLEIILAAGAIGASVACQNWRLAPTELAHCIDLVAPKALFVSPRFVEALRVLPPPPTDAARRPEPIVLGDAYESLLDGPRVCETDALDVDAEDPLLVLYTSGTTGLPKGAMISHRAQIARNLVVRAELALEERDAFVAWSPMYHMGGTEFSLGTLMSGGKVIVVDGFDRARLADLVATEKLGWLILMPGMVSGLAEELRARAIVPLGVKACGVMADLVPRHELAAITSLLAAPYVNTFGATETGCPPCSSSLLPIGQVPTSLSKKQSPYCEVRLVDADDRDVPDGTPGELCMRGPTLFSGYFDAQEANAQDFRGGWFHMGDVFVRNPDGTLDFVDRVKYLIKSGGENVYPAEIERVLLTDPRVEDAAVVRRKDARWGEVPIAFVARKDPALTADELRARCRRELAGYKQPKAIHFIEMSEIPRSASGKVQRHVLEQRLETDPTTP